MNNNKIEYSRNHKVVLENRNLLSISGVKDVESFDEQDIILFTDLGVLNVKGDELSIGKLNIETGELNITGNFIALIYTNDTQKRHGFFKNAFK